VLRTGMTLALLAGLNSCAAYRAVMPDEPRLTENAARAGGIIVAGYTTSDGRYHRFDGTLTLEGDSLVLTPRAPVMRVTAGSPQGVISLAKADVVSLKLWDGVKTPWKVLVAGSLFVALVAWMTTWDFAQW
jgi:hypothetical protein